jgi:hypothetical protein
VRVVLSSKELIEWIDDAGGVHIDKAVRGGGDGCHEENVLVVADLIEGGEIWMDDDGILHRT